MFKSSIANQNDFTESKSHMGLYYSLIFLHVQLSKAELFKTEHLLEKSIECLEIESEQLNIKDFEQMLAIKKFLYLAFESNKEALQEFLDFIDEDIEEMMGK